MQCSYRVRGVNGSEHLTVESYTVVMLLTFTITPHSFISGLKPSFSANPSQRGLPFLFRTDYMDSPDCLLLSISVFSFSVFHFLVVGSVR